MKSSTKRSLFKSLDKALDDANAMYSAPEAHGFQTGLICGLGPKSESEENWLTMMTKQLGLGQLPKSCYSVLKSLGELLTKHFTTDSDFELVLPEDKHFIERALALSEWCRGFLSGLGIAGVTDDSLASTDAKEILADISNIASFSVDGSGDEEDEEAYQELVEYVGVAVQALHMELLENTTVH